MENLTKFELKRQILHLLFGIVIAVLLYFDILTSFRLFMLVLIAFVICITSKRIKIPGIYWCFKNFERPDQYYKFPGKGPLLYLIGAFIVSFFPKDIAIASIVILALGDSISHMVGRYGSIKHPFSDKKFLEGAIAGGIVSFIVVYFILGSTLEAFLATLFAMIAEGIDIKYKLEKVDDNIVMPIVAAVVIWFVRIVKSFF